jgi:hypothetical protein
MDKFWTLRKIGQLDIPTELNAELEYLSTIEITKKPYSEYANGDWYDYIIMNQTKNSDDNLFNATGNADFTELGSKCIAIKKLICDNFNTNYITFSRIRNMINAIVLPHKDFLELEHTTETYYARFLILLEECAEAYHMSNDFIVNMKKGEVWQINAYNIHAAANLGFNSRKLLSIDMTIPHNIGLNSCYYLAKSSDNFVVQHKTLKEMDLAFFINLNNFVEQNGLKEVVFFLIKQAFIYEINLKEIFNYLYIFYINDSSALESIHRLNNFLFNQRTLGERYIW